MIILPTIMVSVPLCRLVHISHFTVVSPFYLLHSLIGIVPGPTMNLMGPIPCIHQVIYCLHKFHFYIYIKLQLILLLLLLAAG